jgi:8-oxo-dGTP pyrophosphatase MutT (NUDIX family)
VTGPAWTPRQGLVADVRHALARAPRGTAEQRFEAWAWRALLDEDGPALLTRQAAPSHVTASAIVLSPDARHTCLVLHGRIGRWVQPGGHLEPEDMTLASAAAREVEEETGLTGEVVADAILLSRHPAPCRPGVVDWHLDVQHVLIAEQTVPTVSPESRAVAWWPVDDLPDDLVDGMADVVAQTVEMARRAGRQGSGVAAVSSPSAGTSSPILRSRAAAKPSR